MEACYLDRARNAICFVVVAAILVAACTVLAAAPAGDDALFGAIVTGDHATLASTVTADNANISDSYGKTLLLFAIQQKQPQIVELLLSRGANVDSANMNGITPTIAAVQMKQNQSLKLLLARGAAPDAADTMGMTALHWAALMNQPAIGPLLDAGADPLTKNAQGITARAQAVKAGASAETVELMAAAELRFGGRVAPESVEAPHTAVGATVEATVEPARVIFGPVAAPVTVVAYIDFECPYSRFAMGQLEKAMEMFPGKVRLLVKQNPLNFHSRAFSTAVASEEAWAEGREQAWLYYHETITGTRKLVSELPLYPAAVGEEIYRNIDEAHSFGATGTPAFLINNEPVLGARTTGFFRDKIAAAL